MLKSANFQNSSKNDTPSPRGTIVLSESLILVSFMSYLSMVKKVKLFFDGKNSIFQKNKVKNFKNLEILLSK